MDVTSLVSNDDDVYYDGSELVTIGRLSNDKHSDIDVVTAKVSAVSRKGKSTFEVCSTNRVMWYQMYVPTVVEVRTADQ